MTKVSTQKRVRITRLRRIAVVALFAVLGSFFLYRSFAANPNLPGDVNNDNVVNVTDLSMLLSAYGKPNNSVADLNGDGQVSITDLSILLTNYGKTHSGNPSPPAPNPTGQPPISRDGVKLMRAGEQWKFAGINADGWGLNDCRSLPEYDEPSNMTDENIDRYFRELNPHSVTRIWPYKGQASIPLMDKIVSAAEKHGQYLAPAFFDGNNDGTQCGSMRYGNAPANLAHIEPIIKRYAKDTGTRKTNSIAFWEISNEISLIENLAWYNAIARGMKQWDPKTLVGSGASAYSPGNTTDTMTNTHRSADIDLISIHEYDGGCGVSHQANKAIGAAKNLNKPWYSGESGGAGSPDCLKQEWQAYIDSPEGAGMLYWDFKMTSRGGGMTFIPQPNAMWEAAKTMRHQYQGQ